MFVDFSHKQESQAFELRSDNDANELLVLQPMVDMPASWETSPRTAAQKASRIVQNAKQRINHKDSSNFLNDLKATFSAVEYEVIEKEILQIISPVFITAHGYSTGLSDLDQTQLLEDASAIMAKLKSFGYPSFINSGTLLGYVREGKLIGHDDDLDLGVLLQGSDEAEVSRSWVNAINHLAVHYPLVMKSNEIAMIKIQNGVEVDIFPAWAVDGRVFVYPYCHGDLESNVLLPIRMLTWNGCEVGVPQVPEQLLKVNYGDRWDVPDRTWRFDWRRANVAFDSFLRLNKDNLKDGLS